MTQTPRVHALVLNYNGWRDTVECLESLFRSAYPALQVIVCDNASTDGSLEQIRGWAQGTVLAPPASTAALRHLSEPPVPKPIAFTELSRAEAEQGVARGRDAPLIIVRTEANLGFAGGNNVALRYLLALGAAGHVWLVNNDTVVAPDALDHLMATAAGTPDAGAIGATVLQYRHPELIDVIAGGRTSPWRGAMPHVLGAGTRHTALPVRPAVPDFISGACLLTRIATVAKVGLLDERYFLYAEDVDWGLRMQRAGLALAHSRDALLWHKGGGTAGHSSPFFDYHTIKSHLHLMRKLFPRHQSAAALYFLGRCVAPKVVRRQWRRLDAVRRAVHDFRREIRGSA